MHKIVAIEVVKFGKSPINKICRNKRERKAENPLNKKSMSMSMANRMRSSLRKALGSQLPLPSFSNNFAKHEIFKMDIYRHMHARSNTSGLVGQSGFTKQLLGNMGVIRSSPQLTRIWDQQKYNYSMKGQQVEGPTVERDTSDAGEEQQSDFSMKHQEIEGPTVERDMSELAKESREVTESMMKSMYNLSKAVAALGIVQLGIGAYMSYSSDTWNTLNMSMSAVAFGFPFSMAIMMRHSLKAMHFFNKMEQIGRLQLLTSTMQISKQLRFFFLRFRVITYTSLSGLLLSFLYSLFTSFSSTS